MKKGGGGLEELRRREMERLHRETREMRGQVVNLQRELQEAMEGISQLQQCNDWQATEI